MLSWLVRGASDGSTTTSCLARPETTLGGVEITRTEYAAPVTSHTARWSDDTSSARTSALAWLAKQQRWLAQWLDVRFDEAPLAPLHPSVREKTDALDAAGTTTAAIGTGFAIG